jgi:hypothetical protein
MVFSCLLHSSSKELPGPGRHAVCSSTWSELYKSRADSDMLLSLLGLVLRKSVCEREHVTPWLLDSIRTKKDLHFWLWCFFVCRTLSKT